MEGRSGTAVRRNERRARRRRRHRHRRRRRLSNVLDNDTTSATLAE